MSTRYAALPSSAQDAEDRELNDAFGDVDDDDELEPVTTAPATALPSGQTHVQGAFYDFERTTAPATALPSGQTHVPGAFYDFERDYDVPPPGSPPRPSAIALPNNYGNSNGRLPTEPVIPTAPSTSFFRRAVGAILPTHYSRLPTSAPVGVVGGGIENDGVFANVMAKPQRARTEIDEDGQVYTVPEFQQKEAPPTYAAAQADSVPPYWETTVHAPGMHQDMLVDDLAVGSSWVFLVNLFISFFFQFVGFLLTFLLHTSHAAKYGSRAGLGLTLIQYGFYSRGASDGIIDETDGVGEWPGLAPSTVPDPTPSGEAPMPDDVVLGGVSSRDWLSFLLMTLGWFLLLSSFIGFWRVKRWERSIRSSTSVPVTAEAIERDAEVRHNIETVFGYAFSSPDSSERRMRRDENGALVVIPTQELLEEARLARDLRAAGLL
ncbi:metal homeostatis protein bsd2 [Roridomyces roridus]|uniref:Metal homeostatis protein bsd2 n=1 Tax=Roridomyces roridus TaxID=1738132 RepID=A0AAD7CJG1_9AGAR|nr:metal homeostatis protein bsd2 [Roridomyces roridus]